MIKIRTSLLILSLVSAPLFAEEPPPLNGDQIIFTDDFSLSESQASPNEMLSQPLVEKWKRSPTSVDYPNVIIDVTDEDSELYFGEANNNYLRFFKDKGTAGNLHLTTNNGFDPASEIITISFDFFEPSGIGDPGHYFEIIPGINLSSSVNRTHKVSLSNGRINGMDNLYEEDLKNNIQLIFNHSDSDITYLDGAFTLASDRFDVWINGKRILNNQVNRIGINETNPLALNTPLSSVQFIIWSNSNQEIFLDNLNVYNHPHVEDPDLTIYPRFADDFSTPVNGQPDVDIWNRAVAQAAPPNRLIEVTDADSETYFGEAGNNYMRILHDGTTTGNLNLIAHSRFSSEIITIAFDFFEPADTGGDPLVLRPGVGNAPNGSRTHEITFNNGNLSGVPNAYLEGVKNRVEIVMNNSESHLSYLDGAIALESDSYDIWLNGELILHNYQYRRGSLDVGTALSSLQFAIWQSGSNEFLIDNLEIFEEAYIANPASIPDLPGPKAMFADDFTEDNSGWLDYMTWNHFVEGEWRPFAAVEVTDIDSETYFGESENNYLRIFHDGSRSQDLIQRAEDAFGNPSEIITIAFDFFEPIGGGNDPFILSAGTGWMSETERTHQITFSNGTLAGIEDLYEEGTMNNIRIIINNSSKSVAYYETGIDKKVASDSFDVWINGQLVLADHQYGRGSLALGTPLSSLQLAILQNTSNEFLIDNFEVFDYATAQIDESAPDGSTFAEWAAANLPEGSRGPKDVIAGDGIPNLAKFAFGLDPLKANRNDLPQVTTTSIEGKNYLAFVGQLNLTAKGLSLSVEASTDLSNWTALDAHQEIIEMIDEEIAFVRVTDTEPIDGSTRRFLRIRITEE